MASEFASQDWLERFLDEVRLIEYYNAFKHGLKVTELRHFDHVRFVDLYSIGLSTPQISCLRSALKRHRREAGIIVPKSRSKIRRSSLGSTILEKFKYGSPRGPSLSLIGESTFSLSITGKPTENTKAEETITDSELRSVSQLTCIIAPRDINIQGFLGSGSFSTVFRGDWTIPSGRKIPVAVKILRHNKNRNVSVKEDIFAPLLSEVLLLQSVKHPNLTRVYGVVPSSQLMIVTELAPLGSLLSHLRAHSYRVAHMSPAESNNMITAFMIDGLWDIGIQLARGMSHLALNNLVHRDLAARNVLLFGISKSSPFFPSVKISDFGLLRRSDSSPMSEDKSSGSDTSRNLSNLYIGSEMQMIPYAWSALEAIEHHQFSQASDVWSWAVTIWEIWTGGSEPWEKLTLNLLLNKLKSGRRLAWPRSVCPRRLYQLMLACWRTNTGSRPTFEYLAKRLDEIRPCEVVACHTLDEADRMDVAIGDRILIIDGRPENFWWRGQNRRTGEIGSFPRDIVEIQRKISHQDISCPITDSFIHVGHLGDDGSTWGHLDHIEPYFLTGIEPHHADTLSQNYDCPCQHNLELNNKESASSWRPLSRSCSPTATDSQISVPMAIRPDDLLAYDDGYDERRVLDLAASHGSLISTQNHHSLNSTSQFGIDVEILRSREFDLLKRSSSSILPPPPGPIETDFGDDVAMARHAPLLSRPNLEKKVGYGRQQELEAYSASFKHAENDAISESLADCSGHASSIEKNSPELINLETTLSSPPTPSSVVSQVSFQQGTQTFAVPSITRPCSNPYFRAAWNSWFSSSSAGCSQSAPQNSTISVASACSSSLNLTSSPNRSVLVENSSRLFNDQQTRRQSCQNLDDFLDTTTKLMSRVVNLNDDYPERNPFIDNKFNPQTATGNLMEPRFERQILVGKCQNPVLTPCRNLLQDSSVECKKKLSFNIIQKNTNPFIELPNNPACQSYDSSSPLIDPNEVFLLIAKVSGKFSSREAEDALSSLLSNSSSNYCASLVRLYTPPPQSDILSQSPAMRNWRVNAASRLLLLHRVSSLEIVQDLEMCWNALECCDWEIERAIDRLLASSH